MKMIRCVLFFVLILRTSCETCDIALCLAVVSKCLFLGACACELKSVESGCLCCKECKLCLGDELYLKCCDCLGLCKNNEFEAVENTVHLLDSPIPSLFDALIANGDSFPWVFRDIPQFKTSTYKTANNELSSLATHHCPSIFFDNCMPMYKCSSSCVSLGSSVMRWFHNGCCHCVGDISCNDLGSNNPRCHECNVPTNL